MGRSSDKVLGLLAEARGQGDEAEAPAPKKRPWCTPEPIELVPVGGNPYPATEMDRAQPLRDGETITVWNDHRGLRWKRVRDPRGGVRLFWRDLDATDEEFVEIDAEGDR